MKKALALIALFSVVASTSFASYSEDCTFTLGGQTYLKTRLGVVGAEAFANTLQLVGLDGTVQDSISAKQVGPQNATEQERFALDEGGSSAFDALVFYKPTASDTVLQAKIFFRSNAVTPGLSGTCTYVQH